MLHFALVVARIESNLFKAQRIAAEKEYGTLDEERWTEFVARGKQLAAWMTANR